MARTPFRTLTQVAVVALAAAFAPPAESAGVVTKRVRSTGLAALEAGDLAGAVERARRAALRQAVEEGVGVLVSSATRVSNYALIDDHILSATRGYVRSYEIVERSVTDDSTACQVTVDAVVDLGALDRDLDALELAVVAADDPRVLCVASTRRGDTTVSSNLFGEALYRAVSGLTERLRVSLAPAGTAESGTGEGQADIVVRGRARLAATDAPVPFAGRRVAQSGLATATASVEVEARWVDAARPIAALTADGRGAGASPGQAEGRALEHAVESLEGALRSALAAELRARAYSTRTVHVIVEGPTVGRRVDAVAGGLARGLGTVERLQARSVSPERAQFDVETTLGAFDLARRLSARGIDDEQVEILQVTANRLRLALHAGESTP